MSLYKNRTVSIIIPVYNVGRYLERTINSVIKQTYKDWELILIDDCSTDNSLEIIRDFIKKYSNIKLISQKVNGGAAVARNIGLDQASGRYVAFLDGDDEWCPQKLQRQLKYMRERDASISCTAMDTMDIDNNLLGNVREVREKISYDFLLTNTMVSTSTVIIDRNKIGNFRMPLLRSGQDYATWLMLLRSGTICYGLNEVYTHYRITPSSLSSNKLKSIYQVWYIQTQLEKLSPLRVTINVLKFAFNATKKRLR